MNFIHANFHMKSKILRDVCWLFRLPKLSSSLALAKTSEDSLKSPIAAYFFYMTFRRNLYDTWKIFFKPVRIISIIENVFDQKLCAAIMKTITGHREWKRT